MAYIKGNVTGHYELFDLLRSYLTGRPTEGTHVYTGTGNGTMDDFFAYPKCPTESWTVEATSATNFTVTGSVSGSKAAATVGTPYDNGFIAFTLTAGGTAFVSGDDFVIPLTEGALTTDGQAYHELEYGSVTSTEDASTLDHFVYLKAPGITVVPTLTGTGNGTLTGITRYSYDATTAESWEIKCTATTSVFTVTGSISGAEANATVGTIYDNGKIRFLITAGGTAFVQDDTFIIGEPQEIFLSFATYQDTFADYYNLQIAGATGYIAGQDDLLGNQPGSSGGKGVPLFNSILYYTIAANGQRFCFDVKVETQYMFAYAGFGFPNGTPTQIPYPICVGGMIADNSAIRYSESNCVFPLKTRDNMFVRQPSGNWIEADMWPYQSNLVDGDFSDLRDTENNYPLLPIVVMRNDAYDQYCELDGVNFISGFQVLVEDTVTIGGDTHQVVSNWGRTGFDDYCTIKLD